MREDVISYPCTMMDILAVSLDAEVVVRTVKVAPDSTNDKVPLAPLIAVMLFSDKVAPPVSTTRLFLYQTREPPPPDTRLNTT